MADTTQITPSIDGEPVNGSTPKDIVLRHFDGASLVLDMGGSVQDPRVWVELQRRDDGRDEWTIIVHPDDGDECVRVYIDANNTREYRVELQDR